MAARTSPAAWAAMPYRTPLHLQLFHDGQAEGTCTDDEIKAHDYSSLDRNKWAVHRPSNTSTLAFIRNIRHPSLINYLPRPTPSYWS